MPLGPPLDHDPVAVVSARLGPPLDFNPFERPGPDPETTIMGELGEVGLGILRGAVHATGTAMRGAATASPPIDRYRALLDKLERYGAGEGDFDALLDRYTGHPELRGDPMLRAAMEGARGDAEAIAGAVARTRRRLEARDVDTKPTDGQKEAGNYRDGAERGLPQAVARAKIPRF